MPREKSVGVIIFREEKGKRYYLLLHYEAGHWEFVKGHLEERESEIETLKRETFEETGISDIKIINGFKEYIKYFFRQTYGLKKEKRKKAGWIFKIVVFYLAETKTKEVKTSYEHLDYKWLVYHDALSQITYKGSKEILKKANDFLVSKKSL